MKKTITLLLGVALIVLGIGGIALASGILPHGQITGEKLVGWGPHRTHENEAGDTTNIYVMYQLSNPDCVSEITIEKICIMGQDGSVHYEGELLGRDDAAIPQVILPHQIRVIFLKWYGIEYGILGQTSTFYTVEVFWSQNGKKGLALSGWGEEQHWVEGKGFVAKHYIKMENMKQKAKVKSDDDD